jgi:hypothetical protein
VGVAVDALASWTAAAAEDAAEQERLATALEASGLSMTEWAAAVDAAVLSGQQLAFTDTEVRDALVPLAQATKDMALTQEGLATAMDVARLKGVDLATAADAVAMAYQGQGTKLAKLLDMSAAGLTATEVLTEAQKRAAGQSEAYGDTLKGKMGAAQIAFSEITEEIGAAFLPILADLLEALAPILLTFAELVGEVLPLLEPILKLAGIQIKLVAAGLKILLDIVKAVVEWIGNAVQQLLDFVATLGPVQAALQAVGAAVAAVTGNGGGGAGGQLLAGGGMGVAGAGGGVNVYVYGGDPAAVSREVIGALRTYTRTNGAPRGLGLGIAGSW